jgi:hypothetical protein
MSPRQPHLNTIRNDRLGPPEIPLCLEILISRHGTDDSLLEPLHPLCTWYRRVEDLVRLGLLERGGRHGRFFITGCLETLIASDPSYGTEAISCLSTDLSRT